MSLVHCEITLTDFLPIFFFADTNEPKNEAPIKHRVKFKDIENARQDDYRGPLITLKQLLGDNKDLRDLTFSKHLMMPRNQGLEGISEVERGYVECKQDQLEESLEKAINLFNSGSQKPLDLVSYKEALHHAVKISRILVSNHIFLI